jgi:hypothetical protein
MARSLGDESLPGVSLGEAMLQVIGLEVRPGSAILADTDSMDRLSRHRIPVCDDRLGDIVRQAFA